MTPLRFFGTSIIFLMILQSGCSYRMKPKAYVCVEKPPIKVTYLDYHKDITPETVGMVIDKTRSFKYQEEPLNERNEISVIYSGTAIHNTEDRKILGVE